MCLVPFQDITTCFKYKIKFGPHHVGLFWATIYHQFEMPQFEMTVNEREGNLAYVKPFKCYFLYNCVRYVTILLQTAITIS